VARDIRQPTRSSMALCAMPSVIKSSYESMLMVAVRGTGTSGLKRVDAQRWSLYEPIPYIVGVLGITPKGKKLARSRRDYIENDGRRGEVFKLPEGRRSVEEAGNRGDGGLLHPPRSDVPLTRCSPTLNHAPTTLT
jgi:hypothetical protein